MRTNKAIFLVFTLILVLSPVFSFSQENQQNKNPYDVNFTFNTDQQPYYPAGEIALYTYFYNTIKYGEQAVANKINGEVMVSFYVMSDSTLSEINVLSGVGYGIDEEVVRVLAPLKYAPGIVDGEKVKMNVILYVPVRAQ